MDMNMTTFFDLEYRLSRNGNPIHYMPYNNDVFDELITFIQLNMDLFYELMTPEHYDIWNTRGKMTLLDKFKTILGMMIYKNVEYFPHPIKNTYATPTIKKPTIIVKSVDNNGIPTFFSSSLIFY